MAQRIWAAIFLLKVQPHREPETTVRSAFGRPSSSSKCSLSPSQRSFLEGNTDNGGAKEAGWDSELGTYTFLDSQL